MNADDFRDYMLSFLFLRYLSDNYEAAAKKELGTDFPDQQKQPGTTPLQLWYNNNPGDSAEFEKQMRLKVHYVIQPQYLWGSIAEMARTQDGELLHTLQKAFDYIENESFASTFQASSLKSTSARKNLAGSIPIATPSSAPSSPKLPRGWQAFQPTATPLAMPTNT